MATIKIYGASDDLVEIDGKVPGCDEHGFYQSASDPKDRMGYIATSDGSVLTIGYAVDGTGCWRVAVERLGTAIVRRIQEGDDDAETAVDADAPAYSDVVELTGVEWVRFTRKNRKQAYDAVGAVAPD